MVSGCLSQVQVHVQETAFDREGRGQGQPAASQTDRQTDVVDGDAAIVPGHRHDAGEGLFFRRRPGQLIAGLPTCRYIRLAWSTKIAPSVCSSNLHNSADDTT